MSGIGACVVCTRRRVISRRASVQARLQAPGTIGRKSTLERAVATRPDRIDEPFDRSAANRSG
jgi:hypothetical protein